MPSYQPIGGTCIDVYDCSDPLAECMGSVCICMSGHVYDYSLGYCVFILSKTLRM